MVRLYSFCNATRDCRAFFESFLYRDHHDRRNKLRRVSMVLIIILFPFLILGISIGCNKNNSASNAIPGNHTTVDDNNATKTDGNFPTPTDAPVVVVTSAAPTIPPQFVPTSAPSAPLPTPTTPSSAPSATSPSGSPFIFFPTHAPTPQLPENDIFLPLLTYKGDHGEPVDAFPLGKCEGDCDSDDECQPDLVCFQRNNVKDIPGCSGIGIVSMDYCYDPTNNVITSDDANPSNNNNTLVMVGDNRKPQEAFPLGLCEGDCDGDSDCQGELVCFKRLKKEQVPGCTGEGISGRDYCYDAKHVVITDSFIPPQNNSNNTLVMAGDGGLPEEAFPLGPCEGDCDHDSDCQVGLKCFKRTDKEKVPGCTGIGIRGKDYCYLPVPTAAPTPSPTASPVPTSTLQGEGITYRPGQITVSESGLLLSEGLTARIIAQSGERVPYHNGGQSNRSFHFNPDFGDTFVDDSPGNPGGWVYVINSEIMETGKGGVGAIKFDREGNVISYDMVLTNTTQNCGGGRTPWDTWISCEEAWKDGQIYQVDPFGNRQPQKTTMGTDGGNFESFAFDVRDTEKPRFFVTEDRKQGALRRFTPTNPDWNNPWDMLHGAGSLDYLVLIPEDGPASTYANLTTVGDNWKPASAFPLGRCEGDCDGDDDCQNGLECFARSDTEQVPGCSGTGTTGKDYCYQPPTWTSPGQFEWVSDLETAKFNAQLQYPLSEGIDVVDNKLYFVQKRRKILTILDLDAMTFTRETTKHGVFDGHPDQVQSILGTGMHSDNVLYFTEEGGRKKDVGIHGRNSLGQFFTILEGPGYPLDESTGLAFSPDGRHMYFAYQGYGVVFDVTRMDGLPFHGRTLNVKYHYKLDL